MSFAVVILGSGNTTYNNAYDLLDDYLLMSSTVIFPSYIKEEGLKTVRQAVKDMGLDPETARRSVIFEKADEITSDWRLIVLGTEGLEEEIKNCHMYGIPVLDLTKGLYEVEPSTGIAPDEPESHTEATESQGGTSVSSSKDLDAERLTEIPEPARGVSTLEQAIDYVIQEIKKLKREVEELRVHIKSKESGWGEQPVSEQTSSGPSGTESQSGSNLDTSKKIKCFKDKNGKIRVARGRAKKKPNETEVYLTQEEIDSAE